MPSTDIWNQFPVLAVIFLVVGAAAGGFYKLWRDNMKFIADQEMQRSAERKAQDAEREAERERQRTWEAKQIADQDKRWQDFIRAMQDSWLKQDCKNSEVLTELAMKMDQLISTVNNHDTWARARGDK